MTYTTVAGDTWDYIAYKTLGSERYTYLLLEANEGYNDIVVFRAGIELTVPAITTQKPSSLPPWRR